MIRFALKIMALSFYRNTLNFVSRLMLVLALELYSPGCWSELVGIETFGGIPFNSSSMLVPWSDGDLGPGPGGGSGVKFWNETVAAGPGISFKMKTLN